jgi:hypothetical protein
MRTLSIDEFFGRVGNSLKLNESPCTHIHCEVECPFEPACVSYSLVELYDYFNEQQKEITRLREYEWKYKELCI